MRARRGWGIVVALLLLLAGCGDEEEPAVRADGGDEWVPVRVRGQVQEHDGGWRICPGGVAPCWPIVGTADLEAGDVVAEGEWQDGRFRLTGDPEPDPSVLAPTVFPNPCPDAEGMGDENGDQAVIDRATEYAATQADQFAGLWLARPGPVVVVAFTGDGDRHRAALDHPSICVTDEGYRFSEEELRGAQEELGATGWPMNGSSVDTLANVVVVAFATIDQDLRGEIEERWGDRVRIDAVVEVLEGGVEQLEQAPSADEIPILTGRRGAASMDALGRFTLGYDAEADCVYLDAAGERITPVWRHGTTALRDPVQVVDGDGQVIAREGETFESGGGFTQPWDADDPLACGGTQTFAM